MFGRKNRRIEELEEALLMSRFAISAVLGDIYTVDEFHNDTYGMSANVGWHEREFRDRAAAAWLKYQVENAKEWKGLRDG